MSSKERLLIKLGLTCVLALVLVLTIGCKKPEVKVGVDDLQYNPDDGWKVRGGIRIRFDDPNELPSCSILSASVALPSYLEVTSPADVTITARDVFGDPVASTQFQSTLLPANSPHPIQFPDPIVVGGFLTDLLSNPALANGGILDVAFTLPTTLNTSSACSSPFEIGIIVVCDGVEIDISGETSLAEWFQLGFMSTVDALGTVSEGRKNALRHKLSAIVHMANAGNTQGASEKLRNDILPKVDGPDAWIQNTEARANLRSFSDEYLAVLNNGC